MDLDASLPEMGQSEAELAIDTDVEALRSPVLEAPHGFYTRSGGVSSGCYVGLQCGYGAKSDAR